MLVLAIDTSTPVISTGLVDLKRPHELATEFALTTTAASPITVLSDRVRTDAFGHVEHLMPMVTAAFAEIGRGPTDVEAVVVGIGPGPFTGLRVGMATAAALGDALNIAVHGVRSHDAAARQVSHSDDFLVVTDARRKEVYASAYAGGSGAAVHGPVALSPAALLDWCAEQGFSPQWMTGAGAGLAAEATGLEIREPVGSLAGALVSCAAGGLLTGAIPGPLTPLYIRRPDATEPHAPKPVLPGN